MKKIFKAEIANVTVFVEYQIEPISFSYAKSFSAYLQEKIWDVRGCNVEEYLMVGDQSSRLTKIVDQVKYQFGSIQEADMAMDEIGDLIEEYGRTWVESNGGYAVVGVK